MSLAPFLTELAYSAGAGKRLVGVSSFSDFPPEARALPQVGTAMGPEIEALAALRPDLVLAWEDSIRPGDIERIERLGTPVFVTRAKRLEDVPRLLEAVGLLAGLEVAGAADGYRARLARARDSTRSVPRARLRRGLAPPAHTIAGPHWINEALDLCGGENVFREMAMVAPWCPGKSSTGAIPA